MNITDTVALLSQPCAVLFAYIGWADLYDGTESISANFAWLRDHPIDNSEASAFVADEGFFYCGVGRGSLGVARAHVVFVAKDPTDGRRKVVGLYARAEASPGHDNWMNVRTRSALRYPIDMRPVVPYWPGAQGMRRWAHRPMGRVHGDLRHFFEELVRDLRAAGEHPLAPTNPEPFDALEGEAKRRMVVHRSREARMRKAKLAEALRAGGGRLRCEVPHCGFDFAERYGALGVGFAEVHHLKPLSSFGGSSRTVRLSDLSVRTVTQ